MRMMCGNLSVSLPPCYNICPWDYGIVTQSHFAGSIDGNTAFNFDKIEAETKWAVEKSIRVGDEMIALATVEVNTSIYSSYIMKVERRGAGNMHGEAWNSAFIWKTTNVLTYCIQ